MLTTEGIIVMLVLPLVGGVVLSLVVMALTQVGPPAILLCAGQRADRKRWTAWALQTN